MEEGGSVEGAAQDADEQLRLPPVAIEAEDELVEVALEVLGADAWKVPRSQTFRFPKTVWAQGSRWTDWRPGRRRPSSGSRRNLHDHHVTFRSAGGSDAPSNRITLQRIRGRTADALVFELGLRRGAPPLVRYRSGDVVLPLQ